MEQELPPAQFYQFQFEEKTKQVADPIQKLGHSEIEPEFDLFLHYWRQPSRRSNKKVERCANQEVVQWHHRVEDQWPKQT
jgi:hypothetical protein